MDSDIVGCIFRASTEIVLKDKVKKKSWNKVEKTETLIQINKLIYQFLKNYCKNLFAYYTPEKWVPHITLVMNDLSEETFERGWNKVNRLKIRFKQTLHNICIVKQYPNKKIKIVKKFRL